MTWRTVPDFENYSVNDLGEVRSKERVDSRGYYVPEKLLKPSKAGAVSLSNGPRKRSFTVDQLRRLVGF